VDKLKALPVQLIEVDGGVIVRRGCTQVKITGEGAAEVVELVLNAAFTEGGVTPDEVSGIVAAPARESVLDLVEQLRLRRILVPTDGKELPPPERESELEVFYWHFGAHPADVALRIQEKRIAVLGVNAVSRRLVSALTETGVKGIDVVDFPLLRNLRLFDAAGQLSADAWGVPGKRPLAYDAWAESSEPPDCLVATSDYGALQVMRELNRFCVAQRQHFFPVVLQDVFGYVGPLVVPGQTACFECLRARQNANMDDPATVRAAESAAFQGQLVQGVHPSLASVLGDIAAVELTKFYSGVIPASHAGALIEVNLLRPELHLRRVLKVPRCGVCSRLNSHSPTSTTRDIPDIRDWNLPQ
jgi:bacteriocin biosynthesis cyclodehydratase domain-containing protein